MVRAPRVLISGNVVSFFIPRDHPDADSALALGMSKRLDTEVMVTIHILKDKNGKDLRHDEAVSKKPFSRLAQLLYARGFFNSPQIQQAIGDPEGDGGKGQSAWGLALAKQLGGESMGYVHPEVLAEWCDIHGFRRMLPREYVAEAGVEREDRE
jgi:hypothetical protein